MSLTYQIILIGALMGVFAIVAGRVSSRLGAPVLLVFLGLGMLAGEDGLGIRYNDVSGAYFVCSVSLAVILFDGGLRTQRSTIAVAGLPSLVLATVGVAITAGIVAVAAWAMFGTPPAGALLIGAIVASTDAAAVFFLLRLQKLDIARRVASTLEVESGLNDPMAIFLALLAIEMVAGSGVSLGSGALSFVFEIGGGALIGWAGGRAMVFLVNRLEVAAGLYPVMVVMSALTVFAGTQLIGASGFLAVYVAGFVLGNERHRASQFILRFHDGIAWLAQIAMLLTLGLLVTPTKLLPVLLPALGVACVLMVVARPLAVFLCLWPFRFSMRERAFAAWVGLRGAVPIYLALPAIIENMPGAEALFGVAFVVVLTSLALQGWTVAPAARFLNLALPPSKAHADRRDVDVPLGAQRDIVGYRVLPGSSVLDLPFARLVLPEGATVLTVLRAGTVVTAEALDRLAPKDYVLVIADPEQILTLDRIFASRRRHEGAVAAAGEFPVEADQAIDDFCRLYGIDLKPQDRGRTIAGVLAAAFGGQPVPGDRLAYGPVELVVRGLDDAGAVDSVGLALEPDADRPTIARLIGPRTAALVRRGVQGMRRLAVWQRGA
ncbi:potassium/proton antiporter [Zavarzinia compransoris]|uniref:Potassium/proton antiporter n=1 Tax=Zavarzinia compransoris TaxID=1264899 RepID=A0A317E3R9_9PROT|nr:potassium/proton antiporter [Zavarzinia compransoris]PWR21758.1 potassium/proton antiporter [Zavarzinia compransoris]TDP45446.1 potassium/proton antiporter (CPA1 family) [Zavarzinia compransoris]